MQEEITQRTVSLSVEAGKMTADLLQKAMKKVLEEMQKKPSQRTLHQGKQTLDQLKQHGASLPGHFSRDKGRPGSHEHCHAALPKLHSPPVYPKNPRRARQYLLRSRRGLAGTAAIKAHAGCPIL